MDELDSWVDPVRLAPRRRGAPVTPELMGIDWRDPCFNVIWFDPGFIATGWAVFSVWPEALVDPGPKILNNIAAWSAGEFNGSEGSMVDQMMDLVYAWDEAAAVGYEDFILRKFSMGRELLAPVRVAARFEDRMYKEKRLSQLQAPQSSQMAKSKVTDDRLKRWGFWNRLPAQKDARDAVRHCITYLALKKEFNLKQAKRSAR